VKCAYCFPKLLDLRAQNAVRKTVRFRIAIMALACALCLAAGIALTRLWYASPRRIQNPIVAAVNLDLSDYGTSRGAGIDGSSNQSSLALPPLRLDLTVILPRFSDPGTYSISISAQRQAAQNLVCAQTTAISEGDKIVLRVPLDLSTVRTGSYFLSTERQGDHGPYYYPIQIK